MGGIIMKSVKVNINSIEKVKSLVNIVAKFEYDVDLISGRYIIDAKSIMGVFSLDLSEPIELIIHSDSDCKDILSLLEPFIVK